MILYLPQLSTISAPVDPQVSITVACVNQLGWLELSTKVPKIQFGPQVGWRASRVNKKKKSRFKVR